MISRKNPCFFYFVLLISICFLVTTTSGCFFTKWNVTITNGVSDPITVHIKSTDSDLGNHYIPSNMAYSWTFCEKLFGTHFTGDFYWGPRFQTLALMDREIIEHCRNVEENDGRPCFWLVKPDGFYLSTTNAPFPNFWIKKQSW